MAGIDLATAEAHLATWLDAETKVAAGQSVQIGQRSLRRADLREIRNSIDYWEKKVRELDLANGQTGIRMRGATPMDG